MRRYDDPVEVRRGMVRATGGGGGTEGPAQFLWHGRLWQVRSVLAHWVETGPWWTGREAGSVVAGEEDGDVLTAPADLLGERELWRVEAARGAQDTGGVFDLSFDWSDGRWQLVGCLD